MEELRMDHFLRKQDIRRTFGRIAWGLLLFMLLQGVIVAVPTLLAKEYPELSFLQGDWVIWAGMLLSFLVSLLVFWLFLRPLPDWVVPQENNRKLPALHMLLIFLVCIAFMYSANLITTYITVFLHFVTNTGESDILGDLLTGDGQTFALLYAVLAGPVLEEVLFRGLLYKKLARFGGRAYIFYSALLFALFHFNFAQLFYAFLLGLVFAAVMYYTGKLIYSIILHILVNFVGGALPVLLSLTDNDTVGKIQLAVVGIFAVVGFVIFFIWRQRILQENRFRSNLAMLEANGDPLASQLRAEPRKQPIFDLNLPPRALDLQAPTKKEALLSWGFILFAAFSVITMIELFLGIG